MEAQKLFSVLHQFSLRGNVEEIAGFGSGLINDTYQVKMTGAQLPGYVLQRINHRVFKNIEALMDNTIKITAHLNQKLKGEGGSKAFRQVLQIIPTKDGGTFYKDGAGNYWRMTEYIKGAKSYDMVQNPMQAYSSGWAFGKFHHLLSDMDPKQIEEVIPDFHHIGMRLERFEMALIQDNNGRAVRLQNEIAWVRKRSKQMLRVLELGKEGKLPLRILHYDPKFNNILLDDKDQILCIIDLDTVMPGYLAYDFGDAVRTIINRAPEDEADLEKIELNLPLFEAYTRGYFEGSGSLLEAEEVNSLILGVLLLPYMQAVRFLTDYLEGDHYYKIMHPEHNLQRTHAQMRLVQELEAHQHLLTDTIKKHSQKTIHKMGEN